jgi:hypothetical protein
MGYVVPIVTDVINMQLHVTSLMPVDTFMKLRV